MTLTFADRLKAGEILVADGATATNYQQAGLEIGVAPEAWVYDLPDRVPLGESGFDQSQFVFDRGYVLIRQRCVDKRIFPGEMARHPVAHHGGKLAGLEIEPAVFPRRDANRVFIEP